MFSSGFLTPVDCYRSTFIAAGQYSVGDLLGHGMTIKVAEKVAPTSGSTATMFTVMWSSSGLSSGYRFDIQRKNPGSTSWVAWLTGQTALSAIFTPTSGVGTYTFRARLRSRANAKFSGWSPAKSTTVA